MRVARDGEGTKNIALVVFSVKESRVVGRLLDSGDVIANSANRVMAKSGTGVAVKQGDVVTTVIIANGTKDTCVESCVSGCRNCETINRFKTRIGNWYVSTEKLHLMVVLCMTKHEGDVPSR
jgi:hypothetical protein